MQMCAKSGFAVGTVLVTVFWSLTASAKLYTWDVSDYVQDGLVLNFDGIRNAGADQEHSDTATVWKNVAPGATDSAVRYPFPTGGELGAWTANGYHFTGGSYFQTESVTTSIGLAFTAQIVTENVSLPDANAFQAVAGDSKVDFCAVDPNEAKAHFYPQNLTGGVYPVTLPWSGRFWNGALDADNIYECEGVSWTGTGSVAVKARSAQVEYGTPSFMIGGKKSSAYVMRGDIHAFRFYSRKLTDAELAQNRLVDEVRFFGKVVTNVLVGVSELGLAGAEKPGPHAVAGSHTFTATACTRGLATYAPVGYQLETWNAAKGIWDTPVYHEGSSCTRAESDPVVRLTWVWQCTSGLRTAADFSVDDYVWDNLVCFYDGILNDGSGAAHKDAATQWQDISRVCGPANLKVVDASKAGAWTANAYRFAGGAKFQQTKAMPDMGLAMTVQVAGNFPMPCSAKMILLRGRSNFLCGYLDAGEDKMHVDGRYFCGSLPTLTGWKGDYWNFAMDDTTIYETFGADWSRDTLSQARTAFVAYDAPDFEIGGYSDETGYAIGDLHAVRFYQGMLTTEQMKQNRQADSARFHGALAVTNVCIVGDDRGLSGDVAPGAYAVVGAYTFSASERTVGRATYEPVGYLLETQTADGNYGLGVFYAGNSYVRAADADNVRLTWVWRCKKGLRTAADFTINDYVRDGLVAFYDGILNRGANEPHSATTTTWVDCVGGNNATWATNKVASPVVGTWTENGYAFAGGDHFMTSYLKPDLGVEFTIQIASETTIPPLAHSCPLKGKGGLNCALVYKDENKLHFDTAGVGGVNMPGFQGWKGDYWTGAMDAETIYETFGTDWSKDTLSQARTKTDPYVDADFEIGGSTANLFSGTVHGIRFYNRMLTSAELAQNRQVDSARYYGVLAETNVVVAVGRYGLVGDVPAGAYVVTDGTAFTAQPQEVIVAEETILAQPVGYTLRKLVGGVWSAPENHAGASYAYSAADGCVELKWRYTLGKGLLILLR